MAGPTAKIILKILSGPHVGAELELRDGTYVIGTDFGCDLVLQDKLVTPRHIKVMIKGANVNLEVIEGSSYIMGKAVDEKVTVMPLYVFLTIGSTHIMFGEIGKPWPNINIENAPDLMKLGKVEDKVIKEEVIEGEDNSKGSRKEKLKEVFDDIVPKPLKVLFYSVIGVIALMMVYGFFHTYYEGVQGPELDLQNAKETFEANLVPFNEDNTLIVSVKDDKIYLSGYIKDERSLAKVNRLIKSMEIDVTVDVITQESLMQKVSNILKENALILEVKPGESLGEVVVCGYSYLRERWLSAKAMIQLQVGGLTKLIDQVVDGGYVEKVVNNVIWQSGLSKELKLAVKMDQIYAEGSLGPDRYSLWTTAKALISSKLYGVVPIADKVELIIISNNERPYFDFPVESINIEEPGWITAQSGEKYFKGAVLANGYTIKEISGKGVILTQGNDEVIIEFESNENPK